MTSEADQMTDPGAGERTPTAAIVSALWREHGIALGQAITVTHIALRRLHEAGFVIVSRDDLELTDVTDPTTDATASALASVRAERLRQNETWGTQRHSWPEWVSILAEEVGEAAQAANQAHWSASTLGAEIDKLSALRAELVHVAAVAVQVIEHIDEVQP